MKEESITSRFATYTDGGVTVAIVPSGLPVIEGIIPAPFMTEAARASLLDGMRSGLWASGCWIEKEWRVRNDCFDEKGEKTSTKFRARPCKTEAECKFVLSKIAEILNVGQEHMNASVSFEVKQ
ncbi:MAG: hypothetical protein ABI977_16535 [Acidobacteriota bacterium]